MEVNFTESLTSPNASMYNLPAFYIHNRLHEYHVYSDSIRFTILVHAYFAKPPI